MSRCQCSGRHDSHAPFGLNDANDRDEAGCVRHFIAEYAHFADISAPAGISPVAGCTSGSIPFLGDRHRSAFERLARRFNFRVRMDGVWEEQL